MSTAPKNEKVVFVRQAAERISKVVRTVEQGDRDGSPLTFRAVGAAAGDKIFRLCTFTGTWEISQAKEVTFRGVTSTPNTVSVVNLVCGLSPSGTCEVSVAKAGTAWYLVQPNLTQLPGYSSSGTQILSIVSGNLRWLGTTACT